VNWTALDGMGAGAAGCAGVGRAAPAAPGTRQLTNDPQTSALPLHHILLKIVEKYSEWRIAPDRCRSYITLYDIL
jgi:hypothetical protein